MESFFQKMCLTMLPFVLCTMTVGHASVAIIDAPLVVHKGILEGVELAMLVPGVHVLRETAMKSKTKSTAWLYNSGAQGTFS